MKTKIIFVGILIQFLMSCKQESVEPRRSPVMSFSAAQSATTSVTDEDAEGPAKVYICKSTSAQRYHFNNNCRGLKQCKHTIEETTAKKAEAIGLTICKYED